MSKVDRRVIDSENCHFTAKNRLFSSSSYGIEIRGFLKSAHGSWHRASRRVRLACKVLSEPGLPLRLISGNPIAVSPGAWTGRSIRFVAKRNGEVLSAAAFRRPTVMCNAAAIRPLTTEMFKRCANN